MDHIYIRHLSLQRALLCVHNCQTGSEATNHDANVSSQIYAHMCICNWASVGEPHLIMLMCKPHTIRSWAVLISDSVSLQIYTWMYIFNSWQCNYCAPINSSFRMQLALPQNCSAWRGHQAICPWGRGVQGLLGHWNKSNCIIYLWQWSVLT